MSDLTLRYLLFGEDRTASKTVKGVGDAAESTASRVSGAVSRMGGAIGGDMNTILAIVPRAEILKNAFVLWPLALLVPEQLHPVAGQSFAHLWQHAAIEQQLWPVAFEWRGLELTPAALLQAFPQT